ncbi:flagellar hook-basal body complex protein [bacterium]|nr:flagellar hook-basal body complex protein [bacterium]
MRYRRSSAIVLLLLSSCQGTSTSLSANAPAAETVERSPVELQQRVHELEWRLAQAEAKAVLLERSSLASQVDSAAGIQLAARIEGLSRTVEQLRLATLAGATARPAEASHGIQMDRGVDSLTGALAALDERCALHCENIANLGIPGYKRRRPLPISSADALNNVREPQSGGVQLDMTQGALKLTGNSLDLGVDGAGFFEIELPNGEQRYTRNGTLRQDVNGRLVTAEGYLLSDQVQIPPDSQGISISADGEVYSLGEGNVQNQIGTIRLHVFPNPTGLRAMGGNGYAATTLSGEPAATQPTTAGAGRLLQGYIELANVGLQTELVELQQAENDAVVIRCALATQGVMTVPRAAELPLQSASR